MGKLAVIGAGVFGSWTALLAKRAGWDTTLIDSRGPANALASSSGESRIIRLAYGADELYTRFAARALELWTTFFAEEKHEDCFRKTGALWMAKAADLIGVLEVFERLSVEHESLNTDALRTRFSQIDVPDGVHGVLEPNSGALLAEASVHAVHAACVREGVKYRRELAQPLGHIEEMTGQLRSIPVGSGPELEADVFVFAAGPWLPRLFPQFLSKRIFPTRQEWFYFAPPLADFRFDESKMPVWIDQSGGKIGYGFPDIHQWGVKVAFHEPGAEFDPESGNRIVSAGQIHEAAEYLARRFPPLSLAKFLTARVCTYENTASGDFLIDQHPGIENVWLVGGGSGHGFKHGPSVGEYVVGALSGKQEREARFRMQPETDGLTREVV